MGNETHPGFVASECPHRISVTRCEQTGFGGYSCGITGGHCLPGARCDGLRKEHDGFWDNLRVDALPTSQEQEG